MEFETLKRIKVFRTHRGPSIGNQEQEKAKIKYKFEQPFSRETDF